MDGQVVVVLDGERYPAVSGTVAAFSEEGDDARPERPRCLPWRLVGREDSYHPTSQRFRQPRQRFDVRYLHLAVGHFGGGPACEVGVTGDDLTAEARAGQRVPDLLDLLGGCVEGG